MNIIPGQQRFAGGQGKYGHTVLGIPLSVVIGRSQGDECQAFIGKNIRIFSGRIENFGAVQSVNIYPLLIGGNQISDTVILIPLVMKTDDVGGSNDFPGGIDKGIPEFFSIVGRHAGDPLYWPEHMPLHRREPLRRRHRPGSIRGLRQRGNRSLLLRGRVPCSTGGQAERKADAQTCDAAFNMHISASFAYSSSSVYHTGKFWRQQDSYNLITI